MLNLNAALQQQCDLNDYTLAECKSLKAKLEMFKGDLPLSFERLLQESLGVKEGILTKAVVDVSKLEV